jgi:hypothetical protein
MTRVEELRRLLRDLERCRDDADYLGETTPLVWRVLEATPGPIVIKGLAGAKARVREALNTEERRLVAESRGQA